jgi:hypothetical protein
MGDLSEQDKERSEFEAWAKTMADGEGVEYLDLGSDWAFSYYDDQTNLAFDSWQASAARHTARIAELEAEVVRLKVDADRYQFLRNVDFLSGEELKKPFIHASEMDGHFWGLHGEIADNKIDEAMKGGA